MKVEYKFIDKNHPPVPQLKVGDICYTKSDSVICRYGYSKCEVRKVEVKWIEPCGYNDNVGHWSIVYYLRTDIDDPVLKSTRLQPYTLNECGGRLQTIYLTPQEVMKTIVNDFKRDATEWVGRIKSELLAIGYDKKDISKMLEIDDKYNDQNRRYGRFYLNDWGDSVEDTTEACKKCQLYDDCERLADDLNDITYRMCCSEGVIKDTTYKRNHPLAYFKEITLEKDEK